MNRVIELLTPLYDRTGQRYSWWDLFRDSYLTFDRRTLGFTRILLGFYLIGDLFRRTWTWKDMFALEGVLPNHVNLFRRQADNFSIVNAFSTSGELWVLWAIILATYLCLLVGYRTKLMQVLSLVWVVSMNGRVLIVENGGYVVHNLLLLWTAFLPMGDRFSIDAMRASLRRRRERGAADLNDRSTLDDPDKPDLYVSLLGIVILLQISAIYFFNVVHKTGPAWKNGTAVHYVLYVDRMANPIIALVRDHIPNWMVLFLTKTAMAFEASIPVCALAPLGRAWARRLVIFMMCALHIGFGVTFVLGPFAWALCVWSTLLFGREDWEIAARTMRRLHRARTVRFDPASAGALLACRVLARMDRFGLLTFEEEPGLGGRLAVTAPGGAKLDGAAALADIVAALPLGPLVAWKLRLPVLRGLADALLAALDRRSAGRWLGLTIPASAGLAPPPTPLARRGRRTLATLRELGVALMWAVAINQAATELWCINRRIKVPQPEPLRSLSHKFRFLQGWFMFSPNPVMEDAMIVVDAVTVDGRHVNPFTGKEPDFDLLNAKSYGWNQIWSDYFDCVRRNAATTFRESMKEYMLRYHERTGRPEDVIVSGTVYCLKDSNPKWNDTKSYGLKKDEMFKFMNPKAPQGLPAPAPAAAPAPAPAPAPAHEEPAPSQPEAPQTPN